MNRELEKYHIDDNIDHRSFAGQGKEFELPSVHLGPSASGIVKRFRRRSLEGLPADLLEPTDIGDINEEIRKHNELVQVMSNHLDFAIGQIRVQSIMLLAVTVDTLAFIKGQLIMETYKEKAMKQEHENLLLRVEQETERITGFEQESHRIEKKISYLNEEIKPISSGVYQFSDNKRDYRHKEKIQEEEDKIRSLRQYLSTIKERYDIGDDAALNKAKEELDHLKRKLEAAEGPAGRLPGLLNSFKEELDQLTVNEKEELLSDGGILSDEGLKDIQSTLEKEFGSQFNRQMFEQAISHVDMLLGVPAEGSCMRRQIRRGDGDKTKVKRQKR